MGKIEQEKLNFLFKMESIKSPLMNYIAPGVNLKIVTDLGNKDQNGNKRRFYEETLYSSRKYSNVNELVSANLRLNTYLLLEYPNPRFVDGGSEMRNCAVFIRAYAIDDIVSKMKEFNEGFIKCYSVGKDNKLHVISDKVKNVTVYPSLNSSLQFSNDIYDNPITNNQEMGVRITINNEYSFIVSAETTWPELYYRLSRCDLTVLGFQMVQAYMGMLPGMAVSVMGSKSYSATSSFCSFWEDPDDIANSPESIKVNSKPVTKEEKKKSFFSDL